MWNQLFGSAITPAVTAGIGETALQATLPTITDQAIDTGVNTMLTGGLSNVGTTALGQVTPEMLQGAGQGMFSSLGNFGNALMSDQAGNVFKALGQGYGMYNQANAMDNMQNLQREQLAMNKDAYARDKSADERRQKLVF